MKKITVHAYALDNAGSYHKPGAQLTVDDDGGEGCIDSKRAQALVDINSATCADDAKAPKAASAD